MYTYTPPPQATGGGKDHHKPPPQATGGGGKGRKSRQPQRRKDHDHPREGGGGLRHCTIYSCAQAGPRWADWESDERPVESGDFGVPDFRETHMLIDHCAVWPKKSY